MRGINLIGIAMMLVQSIALRAAVLPQHFPTPEAAVSALSAALAVTNTAPLREILGAAWDDLVNPDPVQGVNDLAALAVAFQQTNRMQQLSNSRIELEVGANHWPFPIPLVRSPDGWFFDVAAGREEILNRRIGRNELAVLETLRAAVQAQREYASTDRDGDEVLEFATRLVSSAGAKDGLYWSRKLDGDISPLGPLVARAQGAGYKPRSENLNAPPQPFHGYYFKVLTQQGRHAAGGKYNYVINGNMIGGFALVAWPAAYGESGIMTFIVNQQGRVYQLDFGPTTARTAKLIKAFDPDRKWSVSPD